MSSFIYSAAKLLVSAVQFFVQDVPRAVNHAIDTYSLITPAPRWTGLEKAKHVVFINLDGISPSQFAEMRTRSPLIDEAISGGAISSMMLGTFPAQTSTMHVSALTGEHPRTHQISRTMDYSLDEILFGDQDKPYEDSTLNNRSDCKYKKLTDLAFKSGLITASVGFVMSQDDPCIYYNIPDIASTRDTGIAGCIFKKMSSIYGLKHIASGLISNVSRLSENLSLLEIVGRLLDDSYAFAAEDAILNRKAHLTCIQQGGYDLVAHNFGTQSAEARPFLLSYQNNLERFIRASKMAGTYNDTVFSLMSDHLIFDVNTYVYLNNLFWRNGLIRISDRKIISCSAYGESVGKSFLIRIAADKKESTKSKVIKLLKRNQAAFGIESVLLREDLDDLHAGTDYDLACTAKPGVMFIHNLHPDGDIKVNDTFYKAHHGHNPRENFTTFAIWGPGIKKGIIIRDMDVVDIAPTLGHVLGLDFRCSAGRILKVFEGEE